jgi:outer membrane lipoprotein-sorting protein
MRRRIAWLVLSLPLALLTPPALAEDAGTTVVPKTPSATGALPPQGAPQQPASVQPEPVQAPSEAGAQPKDQLRPTQDLEDQGAPAAPQPETTAPAAEVPYDAAAPQPGDVTAQPAEINPNPSDEGAGWDAAIEAAPGPTPLIGEQEAQAVQRINTYFNGLTNLQGSFQQVDSSGKQSSGRFYVQRPGKLRFDYSPPSALRIVADGHFLAIEDSDLKTVEKYPLESTPFRLLLGDAVDLGHDARIVSVESEEGSLAIALQDKTGEAAGQIKLFFNTGADLQLKEWVITDAQGLATKVSLDNLVPGRKVAADFFQATDTFQPFR